MDKIKYTPGPWATNEHDRREVVSPSFDRRRMVADCSVAPREREMDEANARLISGGADADRILRHLMSYIGPGEPLIHFDGLMPDDGYDGAEDGQTLADAVRAYFAKTEGSRT